MAGDVGVIAVIARIRTQLRCTGIQITDLEVHHHHAANQRHHQRYGNHRRGHRPFGEAIQAAPQTPEKTAVFCAGLIFGDGDTRGFLTDAQVRQRHRNQQQLGENQHGDTNAGGQCQVANHRNINDH
ncbi:hypothetical protein FQZ97_1137300 [compost metagenome]